MSNKNQEGGTQHKTNKEEKEMTWKMNTSYHHHQYYHHQDILRVLRDATSTFTK
jgi:hypothetical protein